jgi:hypothetical protein
MEQALQVANGLWNGGHFYGAALFALPFQVVYVLTHNLDKWLMLVIANSLMKGTK